MHEKLLSQFTDSGQKLVDVVGYFECFEECDSKPSLCELGFIFEKSSLHVVAQEDDSFVLHSSESCSDPELTPLSLMDSRPWSSAIGNPILWSWVLCNNQGYFDGIQIEFSENTESKSVVVQLVSLGSEVKLRVVAEKCSSITYEK